MQNHLKKLQELLADIGPVAVAVSGGVDSMTLAVVAHRADSRTKIFHAISPAVPVQATDRVRRYAEQESWQLHEVDAGEINDPKYVENPANRCYYCKTNLYDTVCDHTELVVVSGTNTDDLGDYRPGLIAAEEHKVRHPYVEVDISKQILRDIAKSLGLEDLHDLPAAPCLSSRVATGIAIDPALLPVIDEAENRLWETLQLYLPIKGVRCRVRHEVVAVEIETPNEINDDADYAHEARALVREVFSRNGCDAYAKAVVVEPYRRGSAFLIDTLEVQ